MKKFFEKYKLHLSIVANIIAVIWALYTYFFPTQLKSNLTIFQRGTFDVFTIDQPIDSLKIILNGKDLQKEKENIEIFKYDIINTGDIDIEPGKFMPEVPLGISVENGQIIGIRVVEANDNYLKSNLKPIIRDSSIVVFNPILFRKGRSVTCDLIVLHKDDQVPQPKFSGEIVGIDELEIKFEEKVNDKDEIDIRILIILLSSLVFIGMISFFGKAVKKEIRKVRRKKFLSRYGYPYHSPTKDQIVISEIYSMLRKSTFNELMHIFLDKEKTNQVFNEEKNYNEAVRIANNLISNKKADTKDYAKVVYKSKFMDVLKILRQYDLLVSESQATIEIAEEFINELKDTLLKLQI